MKIFVVSATKPSDDLVTPTLDALAGHDITHLDLEATDFTTAMSTEERRAYHDPPRNLMVDETQEAAENVRKADALVFVGPMIAGTIPARMKSFLDRVLIEGVAFNFDEEGVFRPAMGHIQRVGLVMRSPHSRLELLKIRDGAHRTILRSIRLNCGYSTRATYVRLGRHDDAATAMARSFRSW